MSEAFIHAEDLCFAYKDSDGKEEHPALRGVSLDIQKGEYVAVLGHNGSGKSTFANLLNLILEPTAGKLMVAGMDLTSDEIDELEEEIEEFEDEVKELKEECVCGRSGKFVWYGTKKALEATK